jgi:hypothetical protein
MTKQMMCGSIKRNQIVAGSAAGENRSRLRWIEFTQTEQAAEIWEKIFKLLKAEKMERRLPGQRFRRSGIHATEPVLDNARYSYFEIPISNHRAAVGAISPSLASPEFFNISKDLFSGRRTMVFCRLK